MHTYASLVESTSGSWCLIDNIPGTLGKKKMVLFDAWIQALWELNQSSPIRASPAVRSVIKNVILLFLPAKLKSNSVVLFAIILEPSAKMIIARWSDTGILSLSAILLDIIEFVAPVSIMHITLDPFRLPISFIKLKASLSETRVALKALLM